jgi:hypothetical protein
MAMSGMGIPLPISTVISRAMNQCAGGSRFLKRSSRFSVDFVCGGLAVRV